jgi:hypothetical protein
MGASGSEDWTKRKLRFLDSLSSLRKRVGDAESRVSEEQIAFVLRQVEGGTPATALLRKPGISEETFYRWKCKYVGTGSPRSVG